ncbi:MAG: 50S ribosomal protein L24 [Peptoniphilus sp.]|uniref:50S ribosomal protein L24 n=1 Tax=Peptoniphilus sp. TaxID=1971214 RepID=UPI0025CF221D|nr:50S ribosomal protein L24 [Peptoniphilus sp.]MCI5642755.1 50S ribosomal protein L24 [Peptoniphilus sp.]MDD7352367.1 50S ribosomal protein L24 [Peptoniphilaceae bacterium]MDY3903437.1 50S ribosomal protein L24 [Peptoniphilus sp.]
MRIKKDDIVKVIAGKDKGKTGKVLRTIPKKDLVVVEKVNIVTKHIKPRGPQNPGGIEKMEAPIHVSNVMYFDSASGKATRIGYKIEDGKKVRIAKSSGNVIK